MKNQYIYQLKALELKRRKHCLLYKKNKNGSIDIEEHDLGCYTSYKSAERAIKKHLEITKEYAIYGGFITFKIKLNDSNNAGYDYSSYYAMKTYDSNGNYNSYSYGYTKDESKIYRGSDDKYVRFKEGDMIYSYGCKRFYPEVVIRKPISKKQWKERYQKNFDSDYSDDCYLTMGTSGHNHVLLPLAFSFFGKLSKREKKLMFKEAEFYFGEEQFKHDKIDKIFENI